MTENTNEKTKNFLASPSGKVAMIVGFYAIILCLIALAVNINAGYLTMIIGVACAIPAWKFLNKITPNIFLIMPLGGWILYFVIKGALALLIGVFVAPFSLAKIIAEKVQENL